MLQEMFPKPPMKQLFIDPAFLTQAIMRSINLISCSQDVELLPFKNDKRGNEIIIILLNVFTINCLHLDIGS